MDKEQLVAYIKAKTSDEWSEVKILKHLVEEFEWIENTNIKLGINRINIINDIVFNQSTVNQDGSIKVSKENVKKLKENKKSKKSK